MVDKELLETAQNYANELLGRDVSIDWAEEALVVDFKQGMAKTWVWGATVRAYYDAKKAG